MHIVIHGFQIGKTIEARDLVQLALRQHQHQQKGQQKRQVKHQVGGDDQLFLGAHRLRKTAADKFDKARQQALALAAVKQLVAALAQRLQIGSQAARIMAVVCQRQMVADGAVVLHKALGARRRQALVLLQQLQILLEFLPESVVLLFKKQLSHAATPSCLRSSPA